MSRVQLALNVSNIDAAVAFYSKLFQTEPTKRRLGYANFAIAQPPLKLVLIENPEQPGTLNHLGVEVETAEAVQVATDRLQYLELATKVEHNTDCCYAIQDKVWVRDPDGSPWEIYVVKADSTPDSLPDSLPDSTPDSTLTTAIAAAATPSTKPCCA